MARDIEQLIRSPLAMQIAIHYGCHPGGSWPGFDYPGKLFPSQADIIAEFCRRGLLTERTDADANPFTAQYEATDTLRTFVLELLAVHSDLMLGTVMTEQQRESAQLFEKRRGV